MASLFYVICGSCLGLAAAAFGLWVARKAQDRRARVLAASRFDASMARWGDVQERMGR